jgi:hypothetical protein
MPRTGASTPRTPKSPSTTGRRNVADKPSARPGRTDAGGKTGRAKTVVKSDSGHEIRKRGTAKPDGKPPRMVTVSSETKAASSTKGRIVPDRTKDDLKTMKKTTTDKSKTTAEEKVKRRPTAERPPKAKAAPPAREKEIETPKAAAPAPLPEAPPPETPAPRRKKSDGTGTAAPRGKSARGTRSKSFGFDDALMKDFVMDDEESPAEIDEELSMDPMELPLELLDPELVEVPRPASAPKPKPKPVAGKRQLTCANCGNQYTWLSVDQLCFNCLKKKLSQKKRDDESYPGFTGEAEEEDDAS